MGVVGEEGGERVDRRMVVMCCEDEDVGSLRSGGSFFLEFHGVQAAKTGLGRTGQ
jgi:hypothetical protein